MIKVEEAEKIILSQAKDYGTETVYFESGLGRVLSEDICADRDLPPYHRVTMDGIAISFEAFEKGTRKFNIIATQAAGDDPVIGINNDDDCIEIMTGAALPPTTDTIIRYEDLEIRNNIATVITETISKAQNIHFKGKDKNMGDRVAQANQVITPALINMAAAVGKTALPVKKLPSVVIVSSGDELVDVNEMAAPYQVRRSNNYTMKAVLKPYGINAGMLHIPDNAVIIKQQVEKCLNEYDVIILSGGVSMGKFDYLPQALEDLSVQKLFHKVQQRPGKPFWFGRHKNGTLVFALPGNPVSTFMCLYRYLIPWLEASSGLEPKEKLYAVLNEDFVFIPPLQYFLQVKLQVNANGQLLASPVEGNGSGDFANLLDTNAFMELPLEQNNFTKGEIFRFLAV